MAIALAGLAASLWIAAALLALAGAADSVSAVCRSTINQSVTPDRMRGRMSSVFSLVVTSGPRLGDVESGAVAALTSARFSVASGGLACVAGVGLIVAGLPGAGALRRRARRRGLARARGLSRGAAPLWSSHGEDALHGRGDGHRRSRRGPRKTTDGALEVDLRLPTEMGGQGGGTNPEQLFAVGYAACFEGALGAVARRTKAETGDVSIDSKVSLHPNESRGFDLSVQLDVSLPSVEDDAAVELVKAAHQVCPYSNATRGNIPVTLTANGQPVE